MAARRAQGDAARTWPDNAIQAEETVECLVDAGEGRLHERALRVRERLGMPRVVCGRLGLRVYVVHAHIGTEDARVPLVLTRRFRPSTIGDDKFGGTHETHVVDKILD